MIEQEKEIIKVELPDLKTVEFVRRKQAEECLQQTRENLSKMNDDEWKHYLKEEQKIRDESPLWTINFVQREWYKEFLETYPLDEYPSLFEASSKALTKIQDEYIDKYNLDVVLKNSDVDADHFFFDLRYDFIEMYYKNFDDTITKLDKKYGQAIFDDLVDIMQLANIHRTL